MLSDPLSFAPQRFRVVVVACDLFLQGEEGDKFYILAEGTVKCTATKEGGAEIDLITIQVTCSSSNVSKPPCPPFFCCIRSVRLP